MSKTDIEYGDRTWNPLTGCTVVSEGCKHCWAQAMAKRLKAMGRPEYQDAVDDNDRWTGVITLVPERLKEPYTWGTHQHVLVEYMGDLFHESVPMDYILRVLNVMKNTPLHTYQILTKRPGLMKKFLFDVKPLSNVILGVTVENQRRANERWAPMVYLSRKGWQTWASYEPALGNVNWSGWEFLSQLVCGGESGKGSRPLHPDWARSARDFCVLNGVNFFFKQWGSWMPVIDLYDDAAVDAAEEYNNRWLAQLEPNGAIPVMMAPLGTRGGWHEYQPCPGSWVMAKVGKKAAGRMLDGQEWSGMPK